MTLSITNAQAITCCDAIVDSCDLGSGVAQATLVIYSGSVPATAGTALGAQVVLAQLPMSNPAFGNAANASPGAIATAAAITSDSAADATGTASFFRILDRNSVARIQGTVGTSGAELILNSVAITVGTQVSVTSLTVTMSEA